jgi:hypothetical protein
MWLYADSIPNSVMYAKGRVYRHPSLFQGQQSLIPRDPAHDDGVLLREHGRGVNGHDL